MENIIITSKPARITDMRRRMADIQLCVSWREIANKYFGKSSSWLYNKLNGIDGNGGTGGFTPAEAEQLRGALLLSPNEYDAPPTTYPHNNHRTQGARPVHKAKVHCLFDYKQVARPALRAQTNKSPDTGLLPYTGARQTKAATLLPFQVLRHITRSRPAERAAHSVVNTYEPLAQRHLEQRQPRRRLH